jgi:hypothetical protein
MSMNKAGLVEGEYESVEHSMLVAIGGPLVTLAQALLAFALVRWRRANFAYPYLFLALFMRVVAFGVSAFNPNDEARTSLDLGWPLWLLPSVVVAFLFTLTVAGSKTLRVGWRTNVLLYLIVSAVAAAIVLGDPVVGRLIGR